MQPNRLALSRRTLLIGAAAVAAGTGRVAAQTPIATPLTPFPDRLSDLLGMVPPMPVEPDDPAIVAFAWADLERQLAALGVPRPSGDDLPEGLLSGTSGLPMTHAAFLFARDPRWAETFGFEPLAVHRFLEVGEPGNSAAIFAGVDTGRIHAALIASGYAEVAETPDGAFLTFGDELDFDSPVGRLGTRNMNQAVLLDGIAIFGLDRATIERVPAVIAGEETSAADRGDWLGLADTLAGDVTGAIALTPRVFAELGDASAIREAIFAMREGADDGDIREADDRGETLPEPTAIADFSENRARVQVRIRYDDAETAAAEAGAIPERWESMTSSFGRLPYADLMMVERAGVADADPSVAAIDFRVKGPARWWREIIERRDLAPFVPGA